MRLWDWISQELLPLFGELPQVELNLGNFGTLSIENIIQMMFWLAIGYVMVQVLVLLPYDWCMHLMRRKGWRK